MAKIKLTEPVAAEPEKSYHFFGSTPFNWCKGETLEAVLSTLARQAGAKTIQYQNKTNNGLYAWTCRVDVPRSEPYAISFFQPVGVQIADSREFNIKNSMGHVLPITREKFDV